MKQKNSTAVLFVCLCLALMPVEAVVAGDMGPARAPTSQTAKITGQIRNAATNANLEGVVVTLEGTAYSVRTERDGTYALDVPAGNYTLTASYTGLEKESIALSVQAGATERRDIGLTAEVYKLEPFTVAGEREGNALAVTLQRNASNIKTVLSADAFGNIADQNIGNLLTQLPGIAEELYEGEVAAVSIRGISSGMNAISMDGTRAANGATTGTLSRGFSIDRIPADFIDRIEVSKGLTPDMDADSIGGAINLKTKSPLDRKGRTISYSGGTSWNLDRNSFRPIGSFLYSDTLGKGEKLGVLFTASYNKTHKPRDVVSLDWEMTPDTNRPVAFWMTNLGEDWLEHVRTGLGARVDYKLSANHRVFVNMMYSYYRDRLNRHQLSPILYSATVKPSVLPGTTWTVTDTSNHQATFQQLHRKRTVETVNLQFGGEWRFADSLLEYGFNHSDSAGMEDTVQPYRTVDGVGFRFDRSRFQKFPTIQQISGPDINEPNNQKLSTLNFKDYDDSNVIKGAHLNWKKAVPVAVPASVKMGVRYRGEERDRVQMNSYYVYQGADGVAGLNRATGRNDDNLAEFIDEGYRYRAVKGRYDPISIVDPTRITRDLKANPGHYAENVANTARDSLRNSGFVSEDVYAAYLMGDLSLGKLDILGGLRVEETRLAGRGVRQEITPEEAARRRAWVGTVTNDELRRRTIAEWSNLREESGQYRNVLPSLHFKYQVRGGLVARASYSTGIGRPNFSDLLRATTVNHNTMTVVAPNPDLRPQTADNFDGTLEYYFEPASFVSAGVFLKEIHDFIYGDNRSVIGTGSNNGFGGDYAGYTLSQQFNGGSARVRGFELAYQQRFSWLPGAWKGLGLMANYTALESRGEYSSGGGVVTGAELVGFFPRTMNLALSYVYRSWDFRAKMNYLAEALYAYSSDPLIRNYRFPKRMYDLNIKYNWSRHLTIFVDVINVFDEPINDTYFYVPSRNRFSNVFTTAIKAGVSGRF